jgi:hypothetical protein
VGWACVASSRCPAQSRPWVSVSCWCSYCHHRHPTRPVHTLSPDPERGLTSAVWQQPLGSLEESPRHLGWHRLLGSRTEGGTSAALLVRHRAGRPPCKDPSSFRFQEGCPGTTSDQELGLREGLHQLRLRTQGSRGRTCLPSSINEAPSVYLAL